MRVPCQPSPGYKVLPSLATAQVLHGVPHCCRICYPRTLSEKPPGLLAHSLALIDLEPLFYCVCVCWGDGWSTSSFDILPRLSCTSLHCLSFLSLKGGPQRTGPWPPHQSNTTALRDRPICIQIIPAWTFLSLWPLAHYLTLSLDFIFKMEWYQQVAVRTE